jgi:8-oxo-dGTP pyrophosphatase MutT (NUDIX family)
MKSFPERTVIELTDALIRIESGTLAYEKENKLEIVTNWDAELRANPALFNGDFFMAEEAHIADGSFAAIYRRTRFETMMHWKKNQTLFKPWHIFAVGVIVSSDNALIAGRMASSTAAAGRVYFPAGSFDETDVRNEILDIDGNMRREVMEETAIDLAGARRSDSRMYLVTADRSIALFRRHYFDLNAQELLKLIRGHIADEINSELDDVIAVASPADMSDSTPATFRTFGDWHFAECNHHKV